MYEHFVMSVKLIFNAFPQRNAADEYEFWRRKFKKESVDDATDLRRRDVAPGKAPPFPPRKDIIHDIEPDCVGTLDYPIIDYEDDCCCCCCPTSPPRFCYKRRMGAAYICCERTDEKTGEQKITCMMGAAWQFSILTYGLIFGISGFAYLLCLPRLNIYFSLAALLVFTIGLLGLTCTGCTDPGIVPRYKKPKVIGFGLHLLYKTVND